MKELKATPVETASPTRCCTICGREIAPELTTCIKGCTPAASPADKFLDTYDGGKDFESRRCVTEFAEAYAEVACAKAAEELFMQERQHEGDGYIISDLRGRLGKAEAENKRLRDALTKIRWLRSGESADEIAKEALHSSTSTPTEPK